jgi:hypothetical protein
VKNIELKQNLAVFSYVKRKFRSENYKIDEKRKILSEKKQKKRKNRSEIL